VSAALAGFAAGLTLIMAIGAQNAFVLRQGLARSHVLAVCAFCALADAALISVGVFGFGHLTALAPWAAAAMRWGGAAFLTWYGVRSLRAAWTGGAALRVEGGALQSLTTALVTAAAMTFLNPHVYLDTVMLLGAIAVAYPKLPFAAGAIAASVLFFFSLGYGARLLAPLFAKPLSWRILDTLIGLLMLALAAGLVL